MYDNYNRLVEVKENDNILQVNKYNYEGLRVEKESGDITTKYLYDGTDVLLELDSDNNISARNVFGNKLISRETKDEKGYYRYNGHGDVIGVKGKNNEDLVNYDYDAFGNLISESGNFDNPYRYAGYVYDKEVGYYYLQSRMYDPVEGRFIQEDSYRGNINNPLSLNLYTYCENNPLIYHDPNGHWPQWIKNGINWAKEKINDAVKGVKKAYNYAKDLVSSTVKNIKSTATKVVSKVKSYVEKINVPQLVTGITSTITGVMAISQGCALAAMPIPGARIVAAGMIGAGIGSISYGVSEASESLFNVNPLKSLVVGHLGFKEETYHLFGLLSGTVASAGLQVSGPVSNSGTKPKVSQKVNNTPKPTNKVSNAKVLERPLAGDNMGNLLKGVPNKGVSKATDYGKYSTIIDDKVKVIDKVDLPEWIGESFTDGNYRTVVTEQNITFYRTYGGGAKVDGSFVTTTPAGNRINAKINTALVPEWKNSRQYEAVIEVPKGTTINIGRVEKQYTKTGALLEGNGDQILLPQGWSSEWIKEIREIPSR